MYLAYNPSIYVISSGNIAVSAMEDIPYPHPVPYHTVFWLSFPP